MKALVLLAAGSEEIETVTPIDVLRRAGVDVIVAGLEDNQPQVCSRGVVIGVDKSFSSAKSEGPFDVVILPGGARGAEAFCDSKELGEFLKEHDKAGRLLACICAGPTALKRHGIALGKSITSHPSTKEKMTESNQYIYKEDRVVIDGNIITSRGPGTSLEWSLAIAEKLVGKECVQKIEAQMLVKK